MLIQIELGKSYQWHQYLSCRYSKLRCKYRGLDNGRTVEHVQKTRKILTMKGCLNPLLTAKFSQQLHLLILRQQEKIGRNYWYKDHDQCFAACSTGRFNLNHYQTKLYLIIYFNVIAAYYTLISGKENSRDFKVLSKLLLVRKNNPSEPLRRKHDLVSQCKTIIWSGKIFNKYT